jgi:hypothetical protein
MAEAPVTAWQGSERLVLVDGYLSAGRGGSGAALHGKAIFVLYCLGCENSIPNHRIIMAYETADLRLAKAAELAGGPFSCERVMYFAVKPEK